MDEIIAVEIALASGEKRYCLTWGRIQHPVDPAPVAAIVLACAGGFALGGQALSARVCDTLQEARDAPYFFECYADMCRQGRPEFWHPWRVRMDALMRDGREIYYLGAPGGPPDEGPHAIIG